MFDRRAQCERSEHLALQFGAQCERSEHLALQFGAQGERSEHLAVQFGAQCERSEHLALQFGAQCERSEHLALQFGAQCERCEHLALQPGARCERSEHLAAQIGGGGLRERSEHRRHAAAAGSGARVAVPQSDQLPGQRRWWESGVAAFFRLFRSERGWRSRRTWPKYFLQQVASAVEQVV